MKRFAEIVRNTVVTGTYQTGKQATKVAFGFGYGQQQTQGFGRFFWDTHAGQMHYHLVREVKKRDSQTREGVSSSLGDHRLLKNTYG